MEEVSLVIWFESGRMSVWIYGVCWRNFLYFQAYWRHWFTFFVLYWMEYSGWDSLFRNISIYEIFLNYIWRHAEIYYLVFFLVESILFWGKDGFCCSEGLSLYNISLYFGIEANRILMMGMKNLNFVEEGGRTNEFFVQRNWIWFRFHKFYKINPTHGVGYNSNNQ